MKPRSGGRLDLWPDQRRVERLGGQQADGNRSRGVETVILQDQDWSGLAGVIGSSRCRPDFAAFQASRAASEFGNEIEEGLVGCVGRAIGDQARLPASLGLECRRTHVRHPNLDRTHALVAQPLAMVADLVAGRNASGGRRHAMLLGYM